ncbi:MAG TPA: GNAT family N-acetyltransferase [Chitinophagaceae bacterium]|nr:GNAT family N-acetyltransferase [Chitinophagaceae bacterium]
MEVNIRKATLGDLGTLRRFEQGVISAERPFDPTLKEGHINYYDLEHMIGSPDTELLVAEINGNLVGSGYARIESAKPYLTHRQHAYLGFMYVEPEHRGKGINRMIVVALKQWSLSQKITELRLEVYYDNLSAVSAYEKVGFTKHMIEMRMGLEDEIRRSGL